MKRLIVVFASLLFINAATAQKNFEGEIIYKLHASGEEKPDAELKILFGPKALKIRFKEKKDYDRDELLVLFDSAALYTLNTEGKTYKKKILPLRQEPLFTKKRTIAGYSTTGILNESSSLSQLANGFMSMGNSVFYLADTLFYNIPPYFAPNPVLSAIQNNRIVLGAEIKMQANMYETMDSAKDKSIITAEAIEVKPQHFDDTMFTVPSDYLNDVYTSYNEPLMDSAAVAVDTTVISRPVKKATKKPVKPAGKKATTQPAAIRRKQ